MAFQIDLVQDTSGAVLLRWVIDDRVIGRHNLYTADGLATYLEHCQLFSVSPENVREVANRVLENPSHVPALRVTVRQPASSPGSSLNDRREHDQARALQTRNQNLGRENNRLVRERDQLKTTNAGLAGRLAAANEDMERRQRLFEEQLNVFEARADAQARAFRQKQEEHRSQATRHLTEKRQLEQELEELKRLLAEVNKTATSETLIQAPRVWK